MRNELYIVRRLSVAALILFLLMVGVRAMTDFNQQPGDRPRLLSGEEDVKELLSILRDERLRESNPARVAQAIERLGRTRTIAAIDDLIRLITFRQTFPWENSGVDVIDEDHPVTPLSRYPAAGALFEIGIPALPTLVKVIEAEKTGSLASENAQHVVFTIFRENSLEGVKYLKEEAAKAQSPQATRRLLDAAKKLARITKKLNQPGR